MDKMPVYVRINEGSDVKRLINEIRAVIDETKGLVEDIKDLSAKEVTKSKEWKHNFDAVNSKLDQVQDSLSEPEGI